MSGNNKNRDLKQGKYGPSGRGGWEVVYTGFVLILLCFFIMLCSFASIEEGKLGRFVKSFVNSVSVLSSGVKMESGETLVDHSADIVETESDLAAIQESLEKYVHELGQEKKVSFHFADEGLVMSLSDTVLFSLGLARISPAGIILLKKIGSMISKTKCIVTIEGHTDNLPIHTTKFPSNWELSTARAVNVLRYFVEEEKISAQKLSAVGCAEFHPVAKNDTPENRAKNRRVEIIFSAG